MREIRLVVTLAVPEPLTDEEVHQAAIDALIEAVQVTNDFGVEEYR